VERDERKEVKKDTPSKSGIEKPNYKTECVLTALRVLN
jgi:hypothetical protein